MSLLDRLVPALALAWGVLDSARFDADRIWRLRPDPFEPLPRPDPAAAWGEADRRAEGEQ